MWLVRICISLITAWLDIHPHYAQFFFMRKHFYVFQTFDIWTKISEGSLTLTAALYGGIFEDKLSSHGLSSPCTTNRNINNTKLLMNSNETVAKITSNTNVQHRRTHLCMLALILKRPGRTIVSFAAVVIHSMLLAEFPGSIKSIFHQTWNHKLARIFI